MADKKFPLQVIIEAVDRATGPVREINQKIQATLAPVNKLSNSVKGFLKAAGLPDIKRPWDNFTKSLDTVNARAKSIAKTFLWIGGAATAAFLGIKRGAEAGDVLAKTSRRVGLTVDEFASLQFAAKRAGIDTNHFASSMDLFSLSLGEARAGMGHLHGLLKMVSPAFQKQLLATTSNGEAFDLLIKALDRLDDPSKRAALTASIFGKKNLAMANLVAGGTEEIEKARAEYLRIAGEQKKFAEESEKFSDAWDDVSTAMEGVRNAALGELLPELTTIIKQVTEVIAGNRDSIRASIDSFVKDGGLKKLADGIIDVVKLMGSLVSMAWKVTEALGGIDNVVKILVGVQFARLGISLGVMVVRFGQLAYAIYPFAKTIIQFVMPTIKALIYRLYLLGAQMIYIGAPIFAVVAALGSLYFAYRQISKAVEQAGGWGMVWEDLKRITGDSIDWMIAKFNALIDMVPDWLVNFFGGSAVGAALNVGFGPPAGVQPANANAGGVNRSESNVTVDFKNLPKGTRVDSDTTSGSDLNLSLGYQMALGTP